MLPEVSDLSDVCDVTDSSRRRSSQELGLNTPPVREEKNNSH